MEWAQEGERENIKMGDTFDLTIQSVQPLTYNHSPVISLVGAVLRRTVKECERSYLEVHAVKCYMNVEFGSDPPGKINQGKLPKADF